MFLDYGQKEGKGYAPLITFFFPIKFFKYKRVDLFLGQ